MDPKILIGNQYLAEALNLIREAKRTIYIIIFDWRFYPDISNHPEKALTDEIVKANERGVSVKVIANSDAVKDRLTTLKIKCKRIVFYKMVHAKLLLIDENIAVIGSHNFTQSAFEKNLEISVAIEDKKAGQVLTGYFLTLWG